MNQKGSGRQWGKAVIIGGSMAGKLAARALAEFFEEVLVIEQDDEPQGPQPRPGTPQCHHTHALLKSGEFALDSLFPGFMKQLVEQGSVQIDFMRDISWTHHGFRFIRYESDFEVHQQSRPFLEWQAHRRLQECPNVKWAYGSRVIRYLFDESGSRIGGVEAECIRTGQRTLLQAALVIDAAGHATRTPDQLSKHGLQRARESKIGLNLAYATRVYELDPLQSRDWQTIVNYPSPPVNVRGGMIFPLEGNRWSVTLVGYGEEHHPPVDGDAFLQFAGTLTQPEIYEQLKRAKPLGDVRLYRFPGQILRHYDKLKRMPQGLLVIGDAFCRLNPVYAQGVSIACLEALELQKALRQASGKPRLPDRFAAMLHKRFAKLLAPVWMTVSADAFLYPTTTGRKPRGLSFLQWYVRRIYRLAEFDRTVYEKFVNVLNLLESPYGFFGPKIMYKALTLKHATPANAKRTTAAGN